MSSAEQKRMLIACRQVTASGNFDAGLVSLCRLLRSTASAGGL
jgi:hypothetical protein